MPNLPTSAVLHHSGLGTANLTINGRPVSDARLGPGLSDYRLAARAVSDDVTDLVREVAGAGELVLAADLGRGFFDMHTPEVWMWVDAPWRDRPRLTAELHLGFDDGTTQVLTTDDTWRTSTGGTTFDSLYEGEDWDESLEPHGWREPDFDDSTWAAAFVLTDHPMTGRTNRRYARELATTGLPLRESLAEPIRVVETLNLEWTRLTDGRWVGDVGRVIAGWADLVPLVDRLEPGRVLEVEVKYGEELADDGSVHCENRFIKTGRFQLDRVRLDGRPWQSRHSWKGFRYLEVRGAEVGDQLQVKACFASADVAVTGRFGSSHPTLTWLHEAFVNTVQANLHWVPTDTPTYEKNGWTGDVQVALPAMLARFDLSRYLTSWLDDMIDAQRNDGSLPVIIPSAGWGYGDGECAPAPEWTTLYPVLVDALVNEYGLDLWALHREPVVAYLRHELARLDQDGLAVGILGDYLSPGTYGPPPEDIRLESSISLVHALDVVAQALAGSAEADEFATARTALVERINEVFLDTEAGAYTALPLSGHHKEKSHAENGDGYRQTPQVMALAEGIVPEEHRARVVANLVADLTEQGDHHNVGCLGGAQLYSVLVREGRGDLAVRVATNPTGPSWESWRTAGHRTLLEMWVDPVRSRAHFFHGAGIRFLEDDLAGLRREATGWTRFSVRPTTVAGVDEITLVRAGIGVHWRVDGQAFHCEVDVPEGSSGLVTMPDGSEHELAPGFHALDSSVA